MHPALHYLVGAGSGHGGAFIPPAAGPGADSSGASASARLQILLVEDEAISALALKRLVARLGHEICAMTAMAEDAIKLAGEILPDIILMDIRLAGEMDGITAALRDPRPLRDRLHLHDGQQRSGDARSRRERTAAGVHGEALFSHDGQDDPAACRRTVGSPDTQLTCSAGLFC